MRVIRPYIFFLLFLSSLNVSAQFQKHANFEVSASTKEVLIGDEIEIVLRAVIDRDWYLYSSDIDPDLGPTPTSITFEPHPSFEVVGKLVPIGAQKKYDKIWEADITYFENRATFRQKIKILDKNPVIQGEIDFLTCSNVSGLCVPGNDEFLISGLNVQEKPKGSTVTETTPSTTTSISLETASPSNDSGEGVIESDENKEAVAADTNTVIQEDFPMVTEQSGSDSSLWAFALAAFLAGLAALLTPCVFPVIPMTVTYFTKQENGRKKALVYGASIILIYTFIGVIVSRINGPAFANFLSTHWIPNVLFS